MTARPVLIADPLRPPPLPRADAMGERPWIQLASGRALPLLDPGPRDVDLRAYVHGVAHLCRFVGHAQSFYSVAQHLCLVHDAAGMAARPHALLHDLHEAAIGDVSAPMKAALRAMHPDAGAAFAELERRHEAAVHEAVGLPFPAPDRVAAEVKTLDRRALATECRDLMRGVPPFLRDTAPLPRVVRPWAPARAAEEWLKRFDDLARLGLVRRPPGS